MYLSNLIGTLHEKLKDENPEIECVIVSKDGKTILVHLENLDIESIYECLENKYAS